MHAKTYVTFKGKQSGIALVEALIAILLFSFGILALVGLQALMQKNVTQSKLRGEASYLANQLIGQMWVDQANLANYAMASGTCTVTNYAKCTNWKTAVAQLLPIGTANVTVNGNAVRVTLTWAPPGEAPGKFEIDATITN